MEQQLIKSEQSQFIEKLEDWKYREAYIRASINVNLPSQIRALRLRQEMTQKELADASRMLQPRISAMEKPGAVKFNIETLVRVAAGLKVGLIVKFVPISEMVNWENEFSQDDFNVATFDRDHGLTPAGPDVNAALYHSVPSTPDWLFFRAHKTMRALPKPDINVTIASMPADAGSTSTVQGFQILSQGG